MRIAFMGTKGLPSKGGTERVVEAIVKQLAGRHEITLYCDSRYTPVGTQLEGIHLVRIPTLKGKHIGATSLFCLCALHALIFGRYDLIHLHGVEASFTLPLLRLRYRVIATSHGSPTRNRKDKWSRIAQFLMEMMEYPFVYFSNLPTSVSLADAQYYESRYHKKVVYIPNGVDENIRFNREAARLELQSMGLESENFLLFCAGRIDPSKGCHLAIEAYRQANPSCPLVVIGDLNQLPSYSDSLRQLAEGLAIHFVSPIADKELLFGILRQCKLFLFPSTKEGMSVMLLEAASLGVPVVCSEIPENRASVREGVLYFRSGDAVDLAEKLCWALDHPAEMATFGRKARETVLNFLPWRKIADGYDCLYKACSEKQALPVSILEWRS
jgi:glycosyltransferase involved in cell wall biosynthesis